MLQCRTVRRDEIVGTTITAGADVQTLSLNIVANLLRPDQTPVVDVVAAVLTVVAIVPMWIAERLSGDSLASHV